MPFSWDEYPYTNFHELNLDWFIKKFKEIFDEWTELYNTMVSWKNETNSALSEWKTDTENDILDWESGIVSDLNDWKDGFETLFNETFSNLTDIKTDAEAARDAAQGYAEDAADSAEEIAESAEQITENANNIDYLNYALYGMAETKRMVGNPINFIDGAKDTELVNLKMTVSPTQSGSGTPSSENPRAFTKRTQCQVYVSPRNIIRLRTSSPSTTSGITVSVNNDGTVNLHGTATSSGGPVIGYVYLREGYKYYCSLDYSSGNYYPRLDGPNGDRVYPTSGDTFTANYTGEYTIRLVVNNGKSYNKDNVIPYLCLINSIHTKSSAIGKNKGITIPEDIDFYAGEVDYKLGGNVTLKAYPYYSAYNGETLSGEWASSMDVYAEGTTPTTGAEVIDLSGTIAETYTFTTNKITIYDGENVINSVALININYVDYVTNILLSKTNAYDIPDYYKANNYMDNKIAAVRAAMLEAEGNYDSFIFITDTHWTLNAKHSPNLIKYITDRIPIPRIFFGGDLGEGVNLTCLNAYKQNIKGKIYNTIGNHEYHNSYSDIDKPSVSLTMKDSYLWGYYNSGMTDCVIGNAERNYYYVNNTVEKIRYIILNVYGEGTEPIFENEQKTWLQNTALDLPNGYTAIIICHQVAYPNHSTGVLSFNYGAGGEDIEDIVDSSNAEIACILCGHSHFDGLGTTNGGIPVIVTTCDKYKPSPGYDDWLSNTRFINTITEQAFDIVIVDKTNKKITAIRIGCPADNPTGEPLETRSITYGE